MDLSFKDITIKVPGKTLIQSDLTLLPASTYALVGKNGSGKSTILKHLVTREIPVPKGVSVFLVEQEMQIDLDKTVYHIVAESNLKMIKLRERLDYLETVFMTEPQMMEYIKITTDLKDMDWTKDETIIRRILFGLGFPREVQDLPVRSFSGGWRMRASLARGLYMCPDLLLLDEPSNHLDLEATLWLMEELAGYKKTLLFVSHDRIFIEALAEWIIDIDTFSKRLVYYRGDYENYKKTKHQNYLRDVAKWEKNQAAIVSARKKGKLPPQVISRPPKQPVLRFKIPQMMIPRQNMISIYDCVVGYNNGPVVLNKVNLVVEPQARIAFVGKNGCGKSTMLSLLAGDILPKNGVIDVVQSTRVGYYSQHLTDSLPAGMTPVQFILQKMNYSVEFARELLGVTGLESTAHVQKLGTLSGGQRARVLLASVIACCPHVMLLDEPTNHLDIDIIEALIGFINAYSGAIIISTHNLDLLSKINWTVVEIKGGELHATTIDQYNDRVLEDIEQKCVSSNVMNLLEQLGNLDT